MNYWSNPIRIVQPVCTNAHVMRPGAPSLTRQNEASQPGYQLQHREPHLPLRGITLLVDDSADSEGRVTFP